MRNVSEGEARGARREEVCSRNKQQQKVGKEPPAAGEPEQRLQSSLRKPGHDAASAWGWCLESVGGVETFTSHISVKGR